MQKLIQGIHQFQKESFRPLQGLFEELAKGQNPETLFITCSDSRIDPCLLTQAKPGDLFILRNAGNIVPPHGAGNGPSSRHRTVRGRGCRQTGGVPEAFNPATGPPGRLNRPIAGDQRSGQAVAPTSGPGTPDPTPAVSARPAGCRWLPRSRGWGRRRSRAGPGRPRSRQSWRRPWRYRSSR